jgi:glutathione peroxidase
MKFASLITSVMLATAAFSAESIQNIPFKDIDGKDTSLKAYAGKVVLIVNVASECGYTPQYEGLQALHQQLGSKGLVVLGVPCNDFGGQEPGSEAEIKTFCTANYKVTFPMTAKISIKGAGKHPLFAALTEDGEVGWNFEKFLIGKDGKLIRRSYRSQNRKSLRTLSKALVSRRSLGSMVRCLPRTGLSEQNRKSLRIL